MANFLLNTGFLKFGKFDVRIHPLLPVLMLRHLHPIALEPVYPPEKAATLTPSGALYLRRMLKRNGYRPLPELYKKTESKFRTGSFNTVVTTQEDYSPEFFFTDDGIMKGEGEAKTRQDAMVLVQEQNTKVDIGPIGVGRFEFLVGMVPVNPTDNLEDLILDTSCMAGRDGFPVGFPVEDFSFVLDASEILGKAAADDELF